MLHKYNLHLLSNRAPIVRGRRSHLCTGIGQAHFAGPRGMLLYRFSISQGLEYLRSEACWCSFLDCSASLLHARHQCCVKYIYALHLACSAVAGIKSLKVV